MDPFSISINRKRRAVSTRAVRGVAVQAVKAAAFFFEDYIWYLVKTEQNAARGFAVSKPIWCGFSVQSPNSRDVRRKTRHQSTAEEGPEVLLGPEETVILKQTHSIVLAVVSQSQSAPISKYAPSTHRIDRRVARNIEPVDEEFRPFDLAFVRGAAEEVHPVV